MTRAARFSPGGMVFHVLNRGVGRRTLFDKDQDYLAFEQVLAETPVSPRGGLAATAAGELDGTGE